MVDLTKYMKKELAQVAPSTIYGFAQYVGQFPGVIKLMIGEPDFNAPEHVKKAAIASIQADHSHYAAPAGTIGLRRAASHYLAEKYDLHYDPETEIIVTEGVTEGIYTFLTSVLNPGDKVVIPTPIFPVYIPDVIVTGAKPLLVDTSHDGFKLTPQKLQQLISRYGDEIRAVILNYPANPTGVVYRQEELDALADVIAGKPIFALCDEIYSELSYESPYASFAKSLPEQSVLLNGVSKSHAMTGYRIGVMCAPKAITAQLAKIHEFTITTAPTIMQDAAQEAFSSLEDTETMKQAYRKRRDYLVTELTKRGFECADPQGTFYLFARLPKWVKQSDRDFCYDMVKKAKVAMTPGSFFGPGGENHVRISYATALPEIKEAIKRLDVYLQDLKKQA